MLNFINSQINQIKKYGVKALPGKIKKFFYFLICYFLSIIYFPLFLFFLIFKKIKFFRFGCIPTSRLGHLTYETEIYLSNLYVNKNRDKYLDIFCPDIYDIHAPICNNYIYNLYKKKIIILPIFFVYPFIILIRHFFIFSDHLIKFGLVKKNNISMQAEANRDVLNTNEVTPPSLSLAKDEEDRGYELLKRLYGINKNDKFVTITIRDNHYLKKNFSTQNFSYLDHRDCDVDRYMLACEHLTKLGYYVFRMGSGSNKKINTSNPKIIDYATNGTRTEFLDLFLGYKCEFCITSGAGYDGIPFIFRKPLLLASYTPYSTSNFFSKRNITFYKHHYSKFLKRNLTLKEIFEMGLSTIDNKNEFEIKGIKLVEISEQEIAEIVLEMEKFVKEKEFENELKKCELNEKFFKVFNYYIQSKEDLSIRHGEIKGRVSSSFLKRNQYLIQ